MFRHPLIRGRGEGLGRVRWPAERSQPGLVRGWWLEQDEETARGALAREPRLALVEAVLFVADEPLTPRRLASLAGLADAAEARRLVGRLRELLAADGTAFQVEELAGGFQLLTRPEFHPWLSRAGPGAEGTLSPAARETLTILAYRQPITRADIEAVRGVGCSEVLRQLMDRGLVRIAGRDDSLGRPQLYGTTRRFLQVFGLKSLHDLPPMEGLQPPRGRSKGEEKEE